MLKLEVKKSRKIFNSSFHIIYLQDPHSRHSFSLIQCDGLCLSDSSPNTAASVEFTGIWKMIFISYTTYRSKL